VDRGDLPPFATRPDGAVRVDYQRRLDEVDDELIGAAIVVADAIPPVVRAFLGAEPLCIPEARAMASDVADRCRYVEDQGFLLLAREAPVSGDLRRLVAILRLVYSVERSAALLRHVAEAVELFDARAMPDESRRRFEELGIRAAEVFRRGVDAWRRRDALAIHELDRLDADIDGLRAHLVRDAADTLETSSELTLIGLLGRYFERIGDHGVMFAQHATFAVTGERVELRS
jgi:phosphate transport system protein